MWKLRVWKVYSVVIVCCCFHIWCKCIDCTSVALRPSQFSEKFNNILFVGISRRDCHNAADTTRRDKWWRRSWQSLSSTRRIAFAIKQNASTLIYDLLTGRYAVSMSDGKVRIFHSVPANFHISARTIAECQSIFISSYTQQQTVTEWSLKIHVCIRRQTIEVF